MFICRLRPWFLAWVKQEIGINYYKPRKDVGAIYVSPVFEITEMSNFADDNFILQVNIDKMMVCRNMEQELTKLVKWLKGK